MISTIKTPIGFLEITASERGVTGVKYITKGRALQQGKNRHLDRCQRLLHGYFTGRIRMMDTIPLAPEGTDFQQAVWRATQKIPAGQTVTYSEIARRIGRPNAARAVGNALSKNPLMILVPCHRVLPTGGDNKFRCGGFALGSKTKRWLLEHELTN